MLEFFRDKDFFKKFFWLSMPIALHSFVISSIDLLDNIMVGQLGDQAIAAIGNGGQLYFLVIIFLFGISSGAGVFIAQFWGAKDLRRIHHSLGIALGASLFIAVIFTIIGLNFSKQFSQIFSQDPQVLSLTIDYIRPVSLSYIFTALSFAWGFALRSIGRVMLPLLASSTSLIANGFLNYCLIFGNFGFPALGVSGAAYATVIARILEAVLLVGTVYYKRLEIAGSWQQLFSFDKVFVLKFVKVAKHVLFTEIFWATGTVVYYWIYTRMGTQAIAAFNISSSIERMAMVAFMGMSHGGGVLVGNAIGEDDIERAKRYSKKTMITSIGIALFVSIVLICNTGLILSFYHISDISRKMAVKLIMVLSFYFPIIICNNIGLVGILRGAGDTKYCFLLELGSVWLLGVPLAFVGLSLKLPIWQLYLLIKSEELIKTAGVFYRLYRGNWIKSLVEQKIPAPELVIT